MLSLCKSASRKGEISGHYAQTVTSVQRRPLQLLTKRTVFIYCLCLFCTSVLIDSACSSCAGQLVRRRRSGLGSVNMSQHARACPGPCPARIAALLQTQLNGCCLFKLQGAYGRLCLGIASWMCHILQSIVADVAHERLDTTEACIV